MTITLQRPNRTPLENKLILVIERIANFSEKDLVRYVRGVDNIAVDTLVQLEVNEIPTDTPSLLQAVKICLDAEEQRQKNLKPGAPASTYTAERIAMLRGVIAANEGTTNGDG